MRRFFILGADDPEMAWVEQFLQDEDVPYAYAGRNLWIKNAGTVIQNETPRVHGHNSSRGEFLLYPRDIPNQCPDELVLVECRFERSVVWKYGLQVRQSGISIPIRVIDHHSPGDPGYGLSPEYSWSASSIGQTMTLVSPDREPEELDLIVAAADHCLLAAYQGNCPGVDPETLSLWRIQQQAKHRGCSFRRVIREIEKAALALDSASEVHIGGKPVADLRGRRLPGLKEAACRLSLPYVTQTVPNSNGRCKLVLGGADAQIVLAFIRGDSIAASLENRYGDPARGYAGGFEPLPRRRRR